MSDFLKGNFPVRKKIVEQKPDTEQTRADEISEHLRSQALAHICGSMVYVEKTELSWDGDEETGEPSPPNEPASEW
jgi:hypothetical protein